MEQILDELHDAVWTSTHIDAEENCVLEFVGPCQRRRWLTISAESEPDIWMTEDSGYSSVGSVWRMPVAELISVPTDEVPEWRDILLEKSSADDWLIWFVANVGHDFAVVTRARASFTLVDCLGWG